MSLPWNHLSFILDIKTHFFKICKTLYFKRDPRVLPTWSYLLQSPQRVHYRPDLLLSIKTQEFVHHLFHKTTSSLFEEEVEKRESSYNFVFLVKFNWINLLHLPPLEMQKTTTKKKKLLWIENNLFMYKLDKKCVLLKDATFFKYWQWTASLTHRFCKAEETLCFPSYRVWCAWKNRDKGLLHAGKKWLVSIRQLWRRTAEVGGISWLLWGYKWSM